MYLLFVDMRMFFSFIVVYVNIFYLFKIRLLISALLVSNPIKEVISMVSD